MTIKCNRTRIQCVKIQNPYKRKVLVTDDQVVESMNMNQYPLYACYLVLLAVCLAFILLYYLSLRFIKQKSTQDW